ncbi:MAG: preprotein translocase subunit SecG [Chitinophagales bacterium]
MYIFLTILIIFISLLIMLFVLVQNPKGSGLGAGFGGGSSNAMGGVQQTTDFLEKTTWTLIIALFVLCIVSSAFVPENTDNPNSEKTKIENVLGE